MFSTKNFTIGSIIAYSITFAFLGLAVFFTISASSQDQAFISSELGLATFSPNGPSGGMLVAASGHSGTETNPPSNYPPSNYPPSNYPPSNYPPSNYTNPPSNYPPSNYPPSNYTTTGSPPTSYPPSSYPPSSYSTPPPSVSITATVNGATVNGGGSLYIAPTDTVTIDWTSNNTTGCSSTQLSGLSGTSGSFPFTPGLDPGESQPYTVICTGPGTPSTDSTTVTVTVPNILINLLEINPSLVRSGETALVDWQLRLETALSYAPGILAPYFLECVIDGAIAGSPYSFNAETNNGDGSRPTRVLNNRSIAVLQCGTFVRGYAAAEVIPSSQEI